ncbi:hypothetical protein BJF85_20180 [Saccharomonospora sp. CUA-673]|uniref:hypothetical protein n=1 Tax=Saccharomonospora sp. CUA-673 TaxID=1904969 RepID=UPI0009629A8E|nr:hypothetical protein [Saccharomonospora sp. CUA-673]OLT44200.1 hypothetical protein BJF85_20180 [Saccharomonospora sp. CUA-673]
MTGTVNHVVTTGTEQLGRTVGGTVGAVTDTVDSVAAPLRPLGPDLPLGGPTAPPEAPDGNGTGDGFAPAPAPGAPSGQPLAPAASTPAPDTSDRAAADRAHAAPARAADDASEKRTTPPKPAPQGQIDVQSSHGSPAAPTSPPAPTSSVTGFAHDHSQSRAGLGVLPTAPAPHTLLPGGTLDASDVDVAGAHLGLPPTAPD